MAIYHGLDADTDLRPFLPHLGWADFFLRYSKNLTADELAALKAAGKAVGVIFEGGTENAMGGFAQGGTDGRHFLNQMLAIGVTPGPKAGVFPTRDNDMPSDMDETDYLDTMQSYWAGFSEVVFPQGWLCMGAYASGQVCEWLLKDGLIYPWSAGAKGWTGTRAFDQTSKWVISQGPDFGGQARTWPAEGQITGVDPYDWPHIAGLDYDPDVAINLDWAL